MTIMQGVLLKFMFLVGVVLIIAVGSSAEPTTETIISEMPMQIRLQGHFKVAVKAEDGFWTYYLNGGGSTGSLVVFTIRSMCGQSDLGSYCCGPLSVRVVKESSALPHFADQDWDGDVDLVDYSLWVNQFTGPRVGD